jgi:hypothetical protein
MSALQQVRGVLQKRFVKLFALTALLIWVANVCLDLKYSVHDPDIWWHLRVGDWILENHGVPHIGILSRTAANTPWVAYSWGYEVLLSLAYRCFGLLGVGFFGTALTLAVAVMVFWMLHRLSGRFWVSCGLSVAACYPVLFTLMPRPVFFTMILFIITLTLILEANRSGRVQPLYWLPLVFAVWANLHIQFAYGLLVLGIFVAVNLAQRWFQKLNIYPGSLHPSVLPGDRLLLILAGCMAATCIGPNWFHLYEVIFEYTKAKYAYSMMIELQAINFRFSENYVQLLLTAAGFFALGRQKKLDPFLLVLLTICSVVAFRTMRDSWFICFPAAACIADIVRQEKDFDQPETALEWAGVAAVVCVGVWLLAPGKDFTERGLDNSISDFFPVNAVNFLRKNPVPGPLYNDLTWGGFLTWYTPGYPVAIDGRNDLYGDALDEVFVKSERAEPSYTTDPYLNESGVVLLRRVLPLARQLSLDSRFKIIYEDALSVVFVHQ